MLPTFNVENLFTNDEIDTVNQLILQIGQYLPIDPDLKNNGRYQGHIVSKDISWDYHSNTEIQNILTPKLEHLLQKKQKLIVTDAHILEAKLPYLIHTDVVHNNQGLSPEYSIIIPLDTYDSYTVCFNEWSDESNDFEVFKQNFQGEKKLKIDPKFCADRLSHLHPHDLKYLSIHDTFAWKKGSVFAVDRRYFHCSDNFLKRGLSQKRAIVLWTLM
jgi:hypothetical protein